MRVPRRASERKNAPAPALALSTWPAIRTAPASHPAPGRPSTSRCGRCPPASRARRAHVDAARRDRGVDAERRDADALRHRRPGVLRGDCLGRAVAAAGDDQRRGERGLGLVGAVGLGRGRRPPSRRSAHGTCRSRPRLSVTAEERTRRRPRRRPCPQYRRAAAADRGARGERPEQLDVDRRLRRAEAGHLDAVGELRPGLHDRVRDDRGHRRRRVREGRLGRVAAGGGRAARRRRSARSPRGRCSSRPPSGLTGRSRRSRRRPRQGRPSRTACPRSGSPSRVGNGPHSSTDRAASPPSPVTTAVSVIARGRGLLVADLVVIAGVPARRSSRPRPRRRSRGLDAGVAAIDSR